MLQVWNIYLQHWVIYGVNVGNYSIPYGSLEVPHGVKSGFTHQGSSLLKYYMEASQNGAPAKHPQVDNFSILEVFMVVDSVGDPPLTEPPLSKTNKNPMSDRIKTSSQCQICHMRDTIPSRYISSRSERLWRITLCY